MELVKMTSEFRRSSLISRLNSTRLRPGLFLQPQRLALSRGGHDRIGADGSSALFGGVPASGRALESR